jgi:hypothetical protein
MTEPAVSLPTPTDSLDGRVVLVTGAARGIGRAIAVAVAQRGGHVAALDLAASIPGYPQPLGTRDELDETVALVEKEGRRAVALQADVRDTTAVDGAVAATVTDLGGLHGVVANAGVACPRPATGHDRRPVGPRAGGQRDGRRPRTSGGDPRAVIWWAPAGRPALPDRGVGRQPGKVRAPGHCLGGARWMHGGGRLDTGAGTTEATAQRCMTGEISALALGGGGTTDRGCR